MKKKIAYVSGSDDWAGLYINGKLVLQNHSLSLRCVFEVLKLNVEYLTVDDDWLANRGHLPDKLEDVVLDESGN